MGAPEHLPLSHRKALCGRLRVFEATAPFELDAAEHGLWPALETLRSKLADYLATNARKSPNAVPLHEFIRGGLDRIDTEVAAAARNDAERSELDRAACSIRRLLYEVDCHQCAGAGMPICEGCRITDDPIVARVGACLRPLTDFFEFVRGEALAWYKRYSCRPSRVLESVSIRLSTQRLNYDPMLGVCRRVSAGTFYADAVGQPASEVVLRIDPDLLDAPSLSAVPYLLFHELVCHAWQGCEAFSSRSREKTSHTEPDDYYAEGWMDFIAYRLFEKAAQRKSPETAPRLSARHRKPGLLVHEERSNREHPRSYWPVADDVLAAEMTRRANIETGATAAREFEGFLREHEDEISAHQEGMIAEEAFYRISAALNLQPGIVQRRQTFVSRVREFLSGEQGPQTRRRAIASVCEILSTGDLGRFLGSWSA